MKCLETRRRHGMKWRRYRTEDDVIVTTYEVPTAVLGELGWQRLRGALERAERQLARARRTAHAQALLREGWKTVAVAHEVGLCDSQVRRIAQRMRENAK